VNDTTDRFAFGRNWANYLKSTGSTRLDAAVASMKSLLDVERLDGLTFLDAGSGSGLFSAAAHTLGAAVTSFDYDQDSVDCTRSMRPDGDMRWNIMQGSLLDATFMASLGTFDVVYCWGVAHHTGDMWHALDAVAERSRGILAISIYNDQGKPSRRWLLVKRLYTHYRWLRPLLVGGSWVRLWAVKFIQDIFAGKPLRSWRSNAGDHRGMSAWHDLIDWVGGYPFEVARPEEIFHFFRKRGFTLADMRTNAGGIGCNEYVFKRVSAA